MRQVIYRSFRNMNDNLTNTKTRVDGHTQNLPKAPKSQKSNIETVELRAFLASPSNEPLINNNTTSYLYPSNNSTSWEEVIIT